MAATASFFDVRKKYSTDNDLKLRQAAAAGDHDTVITLLKSGKCTPDAAQTGINPETNLPYSGRTALHQAMDKGHIDVVIPLLMAGWSCMVEDSKGETPAALAAKLPTEKNKLFEAWFGFSKISLNLELIFNLMQLKDKLPETPGRKLRVISVGCGVATEAAALQRVLADREFDFIGIDISRSRLEDSRIAASGVKNTRFICMDATDLSRIVSLVQEGGRFDFVLLRQPDLINPENVVSFITVLSHATQLLIHPEGRFFLSTYHEHEIRSIVPCLSEFLEIPESEKKSSQVLSSSGAGLIAEGIRLIPDHCSVVMACTPGFKKRFTPDEPNDPSPGYRP